MVTDWKSRDRNEHLSWNNEMSIVVGAISSVSLIKKRIGFWSLQDLIGIAKVLDGVKI